MHVRVCFVSRCAAAGGARYGTGALPRRTAGLAFALGTWQRLMHVLPKPRPQQCLLGMEPLCSCRTCVNYNLTHGCTCGTFNMPFVFCMSQLLPSFADAISMLVWSAPSRGLCHVLAHLGPLHLWARATCLSRVSERCRGAVTRGVPLPLHQDQTTNTHNLGA